MHRLVVCSAFCFFLFLTTVFAASLRARTSFTPSVEHSLVSFFRYLRSLTPHVPFFTYPPLSKEQALVGFDTKNVPLKRTGLDNCLTLLTEPIYTTAIYQRDHDSHYHRTPSLRPPRCTRIPEAFGTWPCGRSRSRNGPQASFRLELGTVW